MFFLLCEVNVDGLEGVKGRMEWPKIKGGCFCSLGKLGGKD